MIHKSTRRTLIALAGASVGTAAVVVAPTATFAAAPHVAANNPSGTAAAKVNAKPLTTTVSPNNAAGDCTSSTQHFQNDGTFLLIPSTSGGDPNCSLRNGDSGAPVIKLQQALNQCYTQGLSVDGQYGPLTAGAVGNVQRFKGQPVTGVFGPFLSVNMQWPEYIVNSSGTLVNTGACGLPS
jgi:peptidoglycan hydrolase-like protein with peptidoglycan-binding domain